MDPWGRATQALGIVAGLVALAYLLGGSLLALRLFVEGYAPDEIAGVVGDLPKEFVVTVGLVEAFAVAAFTGLVFGLAAAALDLPKRTETARSLNDPRWLIPALAVTAIGMFVPLVVIEFDRGWRLAMLFPLFIATLAAMGAGARALREVGENKKHRRQGALATGLVVAVIGVPICTAWSVQLGFPTAEVCLRDSSKAYQGRLIADTPERVVLLDLSDEEHDPIRSINSIPADLVERVDVGTQGTAPDCELAPPPSSDR